LTTALTEWLADSGTGPIAALERIGTVRRVEPGPRARDPRLGVRHRADFRAALRLRKSALAKVDSVQRYALSRGCRRRALLRYFGEAAARRCGSCDRCSDELG
jgi:ATP-dependent DNA helicase RecQ